MKMHRGSALQEEAARKKIEGRGTRFVETYWGHCKIWERGKGSWQLIVAGGVARILEGHFRGLADKKKESLRGHLESERFQRKIVAKGKGERGGEFKGPHLWGEGGSTGKPQKGR